MKEQLKKRGSFEFYKTSFSYIDQEDGAERTVAVPEQGGLQIDVQRSVVDQVVGRCKTEASQKPVPIDEYTMGDLLTWFRETPFREPEDWVFATNSRRAGKKRGKQPLWLSTVMRYHIDPVVRRLGIRKRVGWHTFRRTYGPFSRRTGKTLRLCRNYYVTGQAESPWTSTLKRRCRRNEPRNRRSLRWCASRRPM